MTTTQFSGRKETIFDLFCFNPYPPHLLNHPDLEDMDDLIYAEYKSDRDSSPISCAKSLHYYLSEDLEDYTGQRHGIIFDAFRDID